MTVIWPVPWLPGADEQGSLADATQQNFDAASVAVGSLSQYAPWITPSLLNSWLASSGTDSQPGYFRDVNGVVHLKGLVKSGSSASAVMFTLPAGYRPLLNAWFPGNANGSFCTIHITPAGDVNAASGGSTTWTSLDGVSFRAEA